MSDQANQYTRDIVHCFHLYTRYIHVYIRDFSAAVKYLPSPGIEKRAPWSRQSRGR
jgi:hypothetical protein